jgi:hypothetical protein
VFDSLRGLIAAVDPGERYPLNPNDPLTIEKVEGPILKAVQTQDLTAAIIDHATKEGHDSQQYGSAGSAAKQAVVDVEYFWTEVEHFSKRQVGRVKLKVMKDRDGELETERHWQVGGNGDDPLQFLATDDGDTGTDDRIQSDIIDFLRTGEDATVTEIRESVTGGHRKIAACVRSLVEDGAIEESGGSRKRYWYNGE